MHWFLRTARLMATLLVTTIVSSILTVGTTAIVVDRYIHTVLDQFHIFVGRQPLTLVSMWRFLLGLDKGTKGDIKAAINQKKNGLFPNEALPVMGGFLGHQKSKIREDVVVSLDSISKKRKKLSGVEKGKIFEKLIRKLPQEEWQMLSVLMEGGLTSGEVVEVEQVLSKYLNDKEYEEMRRWIVIEPKKQ